MGRLVLFSIFFDGVLLRAGIRHAHTHKLAPTQDLFINILKDDHYPSPRYLVLASDSTVMYVFTLSSQASSRISRASIDTALLWSCSCVTNSSMPQLLKNSTLARSSTRRCLVAYNLQGCSVIQEALAEKEKKEEQYSFVLFFNQ